MISLSVLDLAAASALVLLLAATSFWLQLSLERQLLVAAVRSWVQLALVGLVLKQIFLLKNPWILALIGLVMLLVAAKEVLSRQQRRFSGYWSYGIGAGSMFISSFSITFLALLFLLGNQPWWEPQYSVPLLGMMLGNTMNGIALGLNQVTEKAYVERDLIEGRLALGQSSGEAVSDIRKRAVQVGLTPILSTMAIAGLVSLPGMMTGQILAGGDPFEASKYQVMIIFMIAGGTGFGVLFSVFTASYRLFDQRGRLRLDRLKSRKF